VGSAPQSGRKHGERRFLAQLLLALLTRFVLVLVKEVRHRLHGNRSQHAGQSPEGDRRPRALHDFLELTFSA